MEAAMLAGLCMYVRVRGRVCVCACAGGRSTRTMERLLHYYNRQEPPMKGPYTPPKTKLNSPNVVPYAAVLTAALPPVHHVRSELITEAQSSDLVYIRVTSATRDASS